LQISGNSFQLYTPHDSSGGNDIKNNGVPSNLTIISSPLYNDSGEFIKFQLPYGPVIVTDRAELCIIILNACGNLKHFESGTRKPGISFIRGAKDMRQEKFEISIIFYKNYTHFFLQEQAVIDINPIDKIIVIGADQRHCSTTFYQ